MACGRKISYPISPPRPKKTQEVTINDDVFDMIEDVETGKHKPITRYTWQNENQMKVQMIDYGATVTAMEVPDKKGSIDDVVLGFSSFEQYEEKPSYYMGSTIGRVANKISNAALTIRDKTFRLDANIPPHHMNGGTKGFDRALWSSRIDEKRVVMSHHSPDNDAGFPGDVIVNAFFELTDENEFIIEYRAYSTKPTWVNLTNQIYFNLAGHDAGAAELYNHSFSINAEHISEVNRLMIPTGHRIPIDKCPFDLRSPKLLKEIFIRNPDMIGFDHNYCITKGEYQQDSFVARVQHSQSGRILEVYSNQPTVQFYTGNKLPVAPENYKGDPKKLDTLVGKSLKNYNKHGGFCLSPQYFPDAINHQDKVPFFILNPGDIYYNTMRYKFLLQK
ncbi:galactose mutarotase-like [Coccinella septempunctata]|uniref:galactose mutarotase-like n=1 Tax=Coccinella septempunctata TaxID=41139 RepID=UPI001D0909EF|nr:galactose mutarotase-like [Coccinella septempunctata]